MQQAAGEWSDTFYTLYTLNPLAGIIDAFQSVVAEDHPICLPFFPARS